ncbi:hypothetical protein RHMOL_Rhmol13G0186400 [Rhododendron molle]|uniref:Uncharacterized protein n=1 Tax=Rhododendron molle TaxID=49168 RepID=A0ACC0L833_RHOML|nr:hypothetical protein RHMOL_Rhmol13G0186400 [Rhododendron molle]
MKYIIRAEEEKSFRKVEIVESSNHHIDSSWDSKEGNDVRDHYQNEEGDIMNYKEVSNGDMEGSVELRRVY